MSRPSDQSHGVDARWDVSSLDDRELVKRLRQLQFDAMAELYERHSSGVHTLATHVWGSTLADEVVQDVFACLWQSPDSYDADRGSVGVHLSMEVRLWERATPDPELDARAAGVRAADQRLLRSGLAQLHRRITDRAPFGSRSPL